MTTTSMADRQKLVQDFARSALAAVAAKGNGRAAAHGVAAADASGSSNSVKSIKVPVTEQWKSFQVESKARSLRDRKDRELLRTCFAVWSMQRLKVRRQTARDNALLVKYAFSVWQIKLLQYDFVISKHGSWKRRNKMGACFRCWMATAFRSLYACQKEKNASQWRWIAQQQDHLGASSGLIEGTPFGAPNEFDIRTPEVLRDAIEGPENDGGVEREASSRATLDVFITPHPVEASVSGLDYESAEGEMPGTYLNLLERDLEGLQQILRLNDQKLDKINIIFTNLQKRLQNDPQDAGLDEHFFAAQNEGKLSRACSEAIQERLRLYGQICAKAKAHLVQLQQSNDVLARKGAEVEASQEMLRAELRSAKEREHEAEAQLELMAADDRESARELQSSAKKISRKELQVEALEAKLGTLDKAVERLREQKTDVEAELKEAEATCTSRTTELQRTTESLADARARLKDADLDIAKKALALERFASEREQLMSENQVLMARVHELASSAHAMEGTIAEKESALEALRLNASKNESVIARLEASVRDGHADRARLRDEADRVAADAASVRIDKGSLEEQLKAADSKIHEQNTLIQHYSAYKVESEKEKGLMGARMSELEARCIAAEKACVSKDMAITGLETRVDQKQATIGELTQARDQLREEKSNLHEDYLRQHYQLQATSGELEASQTQCRDAEDALRKERSAVASLEEAAVEGRLAQEASMKEICALKEKAAELARATHTIGEQKDAVARLQAANRELSDEVNELKECNLHLSSIYSMAGKENGKEGKGKGVIFSGTKSSRIKALQRHQADLVKRVRVQDAAIAARDAEIDRHKEALRTHAGAMESFDLPSHVAQLASLSGALAQAQTDASSSEARVRECVAALDASQETLAGLVSKHRAVAHEMRIMKQVTASMESDLERTHGALRRAKAELADGTGRFEDGARALAQTKAKLAAVERAHDKAKEEKRLVMVRAKVQYSNLIGDLLHRLSMGKAVTKDMKALYTGKGVEGGSGEEGQDVGEEFGLLIDKFVGVCGENQELSRAIKASKAAAASRQAFLSNVVGVLILAVLVQRFYYAWRV